MPRPRMPHLHHERTRHGALVWYFRIGAGPRVRIRADYGSPEFSAEYLAAFEGQSVPVKRESRSGTLGWLVAKYRDSSNWSGLSIATRRQRENIFKHVLAEAADVPFAEIARRDLFEGRERRKDTPAQANNFIKAMRGLFRWAYDAEIIAVESWPEES